MRIFRDHDHDGDGEHDDEQPRKNLSRDEIAAQAEDMVDAISDFLSDAAGAADRLSQSTPAARPVTSTATPGPATAAAPAEAVQPAPTPVAKPHTRGQIWRASAAGSFVVVGLAATAAWGQPPEVGVPVVLYGLGWIAYLSWNAARRPSPSLALAAFTEHRAARTLRNTH
ncbi:hypothetical protein ACFYTS_13425 [Nocardia sp. NPDC004151]|uniref:hypothetical protein n=1 Tax=Nocardia sp. NPDC004151 TaxID=3364304 RepID=UPI00367F4C10